MTMFSGSLLKLFSPIDVVSLPSSPTSTSFQKAVSARCIPPPNPQGQRWTGRLIVTQPAAWRGQGHHCRGVVTALALGLSPLPYKGQPRKFSTQIYMQQSQGPQMLPWVGPHDLLRAAVPNPTVPHSYRMAKESSPKPAFTMNCRGIWERLSLVAGCQQATGREGRGHSCKGLRWGLDNLGDGEGKMVGVIHLHFLQELDFAQPKTLKSFAEKERA